jgi:hypothetical protein
MENMFVSTKKPIRFHVRNAEDEARSAAAAAVRADLLRLDEREYISEHPEFEDYGSVMGALEKICMYPRVDGQKPSKIELDVKALYDKIKEEYKGDWEVYKRVKATKRDAVVEAEAIADFHMREAVLKRDRDTMRYVNACQKAAGDGTNHRGPL